jgi:hypothetical protein
MSTEAATGQMPSPYLAAHADAQGRAMSRTMSERDRNSRDGKYAAQYGA